MDSITFINTYFGDNSTYLRTDFNILPSSKSSCITGFQDLIAGFDGKRLVRSVCFLLLRSSAGV